ncbi:MAG: hypothetical protein DMF67_11635 [Acidobacteria bacterium]|nr:MAG: hypothetical protein DMF67_11635 [Acidobacteriota bacterium]
MSLFTFFEFAVVILSLAAGLASLFYILIVVIDSFGLNRWVTPFIVKLTRWLANVLSGAKAGDKQSPPGGDEMLKVKAENFFRDKFGPGSFYRYAHDAEYRMELDNLFEEFRKQMPPPQPTQKNP